MKRLLLFSLTALLLLSGCATMQSFAPKPIEATDTYFAAPSVNTAILFKTDFSGPIEKSKKREKVIGTNSFNAQSQKWEWKRTENGSVAEVLEIFCSRKKANVRWKVESYPGSKEIEINGKRVMYSKYRKDNCMQFLFTLRDKSEWYVFNYLTTDFSMTFKKLPFQIMTYEKFAAMQQ